MAGSRCRRISPVAAHSGDRLLSEPTADTQRCRREPLFMPLSGPSAAPPGLAQKGGYLPLATGVSTVRYPIPQRTFKYVAPVQSVTDETCHFRTFTADKICSDQKRRCYAFERLE
jgi:hypothetical protein